MTSPTLCCLFFDQRWKADFGLSRITAVSVSADKSEDDLYYKSSTGTFAVRWTAPDTMETLRYSTASDVWSFGVVLFEIYANGARPYAGMDNAAVITDVMAGYRMPQPEGCPDSVYTIMLQCWAADPTTRPTFTTLIAMLATEHASLPLQLNTGEQPNLGSNVLPTNAINYVSGLGVGAAVGAVHVEGAATGEQGATDATIEYNEAVYLRIMSIDGEAEVRCSCLVKRRVVRGCCWFLRSLVEASVRVILYHASLVPAPWILPSTLDSVMRVIQ
jgi:serine/threonine protein kinase